MFEQNTIGGDGEGDEEVFYPWMEGDSLAPPCHSEFDVIQPMLNLIEEHKSYLPQDASSWVFYDLGCGDGRVCIEATKKFHCQSIGVEIETFLVDKFKQNITKLEPFLASKLSVVLGDLREVDLSNGTVISMYLLPEAIELIKDKLIDALSKGAMIVCNSWGLKGIPVKVRGYGGPMGNVSFHLYTKDCLVGNG